MVIFVVNDNVAFTNASILVNWLDELFPGWTWVGFESTPQALTRLVNEPGRYECLSLPGQTTGTVASYPLFQGDKFPYRPNHNLSTLRFPRIDRSGGESMPPLESKVA